MKRLAVLCVLALPLFGLTRPVSRGDRIGVLRSSEQAIAKAIESDLRDALHDRGFHAFDARATFDDMQRGGAPAADYYVEVVSSDAAGHAVGGVGTAVGAVAVEAGVVVSHVAAELRVYDGRTLAEINRFALRQKSTAVVPTGLGVGSRPFWAFVTLPFVRYGQYRSAAREIARQAADLIAGR